MDVTIKNWRDNRHSSAEGSGVAEAIGDWLKRCVNDPATLDPKALLLARSTAENFRAALGKAKSKLNADPKYAKEVLKLEKKTKASERTAKQKEELLKARNALTADEDKVKSTKELIESWDLVGEKYYRKTLKADEGQASKLDENKSELKELMMDNTAAVEVLNSGVSALETVYGHIEDTFAELDKLFPTAVNARKGGNSQALGVLDTKVDEHISDLKGRPAWIQRTLRDARGRDQKLWRDTRKIKQDDLTKTTAKGALEKLTRQHETALSTLESHEARIETLLNSALARGEQIKKVLRGAMDEADAYADALGSGLKRMGKDIGTLDAMIVRGAGGTADQSNNEVMNLQERRPKTAEAWSQTYENADGLMKRAMQEYKAAVPVLKKAITNAEGLLAQIPNSVRSSATGDFKKDIETYAAMQEELTKLSTTHERTRVKIVKIIAAMKDIPKQFAA